MRVIKFGGTSIGTVDRFRNVIKIIKERKKEDSIVVVVSAIGGITNKLIAAIDLAVKGNPGYKNILSEISSTHFIFLKELVNGKYYNETKEIIEAIILQLEEKLKGIYLLRECSPRISDNIISAGEYLSSSLLTEALNSAALEAIQLDASVFIKTNSAFGEAEPDYEITDILIEETFSSIGEIVIPVVNGFTGSNEKGEITTLGRSGSDFTATILARGLKADLVEIWTDVDGVLSADPKIVPDASTISELSYEEASELASLGAKVIFSKAMQPVEKENIPILILNTFNPENQGTFIGKSSSGDGPGVRAITYLQDLSLICISDISSEINLLFLPRLFGAIARKELPVILLNQSSSNQSICFVTLSRQISGFIKELQKEFRHEISSGKIGKIICRNDITVVSAVGNKLESHSNLLRKVFETLDDQGIKSLMFLNSASHKNVSFVIEKEETKRTVTELHKTFFQSETEINVRSVINGK